MIVQIHHMDFYSTHVGIDSDWLLCPSRTAPEDKKET